MSFLPQEGFAFVLCGGCTLEVSGFLWEHVSDMWIAKGL